MDELDAFEKRIAQKQKKVGYSRMDLQKSYKNSFVVSEKKPVEPEQPNQDNEYEDDN